MDITPIRTSLVHCSAVTSTPLAEAISPDSAYESLSFETYTTLYSAQEVSPTLETSDHRGTVEAADAWPLEDWNGVKDTPVLPLPKVRPWRLCKLGRLHVDFLKELRPFRPILSRILGHLSDRDLGAVCRTSGTWRRTCLTVQEASLRWQEYIQLRRDIYSENSENLSAKKIVIYRSGKSEPLVSKDCNAFHAPDIPKSNASNPRKTRFQIFVEEAANLEEDEVHRPCPTCGYPSRVSRTTGEGVCKSATCGRRLCPRYLPQELSPTKKLGSDRTRLIGTAASKKNLRRL